MRKLIFQEELCAKVEKVISEFDPERLGSVQDPELLGHPPNQNPANTVKTKRQNPTTNEEMAKRGELLKKSCALEQFIHKMDYLKMRFEDLQNIQNVVGTPESEEVFGALELIHKNSTKEAVVPAKSEMVRSIFLMDDFNMLTCLPLKTGTTNWQRTLASLLYAKHTGHHIAPENVTSVFYLVPR